MDTAIKRQIDAHSGTFTVVFNANIAEKHLFNIDYVAYIEKGAKAHLKIKIKMKHNNEKQIQQAAPATNKR